MLGNPETALAARPAQPITQIFRAWVQDSIATLNTSAISISTAAGLGKNTLGDFLADPGRDIRLETAHAIQREILRRAFIAEVDIPSPRVKFNGA